MIPWMWRNAKLTLFIYVTDMLTPYFLSSVVLVAVIKQFAGHQSLEVFGQGLLLTLALALVGGFRQRRSPPDRPDIQTSKVCALYACLRRDLHHPDGADSHPRVREVC